MHVFDVVEQVRQLSLSLHETQAPFFKKYPLEHVVHCVADEHLSQFDEHERHFPFDKKYPVKHPLHVPVVLSQLSVHPCEVHKAHPLPLG